MKVLFIGIICIVYGTQALGKNMLAQRLAKGHMLNKVDAATSKRVAAALEKASLLISGSDTDLGQLPPAKRELPEYMRDESGLTYDILISPLHTSVAAGDYGEVIRILADGEAGVNDFDQRGRAPIHIAVETGDIHMVALLISKAANVDIMIEEKGWFHRIVDHNLDDLEHYRGSISTIYPVEGGKVTKIKVKDEFFNYYDRGMFKTPSYLAADGGYLDILALLLLEGASTEPVVRKGADEGKTIGGVLAVISAARIAAKSGDLASIVLLDAAGYDMEDKTDLGSESPFYSAVSNNRQDVAAYLLDKMPEDKIIKNLYSVQDTAMAELILSKITSVPLHKRDLADNLLYSFVNSGKVEIVKLLIDKYGLSPNTRDRHGEHILKAALFSPRYEKYSPIYEGKLKEVLIALLKRGADPHALSETKEGNKTLYDLAREKGLGHLFVPYLKEGTRVPVDEAQGIIRQETLAKYAQ